MIDRHTRAAASDGNPAPPGLGDEAQRRKTVVSTYHRWAGYDEATPIATATDLPLLVALSFPPGIAVFVPAISGNTIRACMIDIKLDLCWFSVKWRSGALC